MTKKKDFSGVARNIMGTRVKSLDDFLGPSKPSKETVNDTSPSKKSINDRKPSKIKLKNSPSSKQIDPSQNKERVDDQPQERQPVPALDKKNEGQSSQSPAEKPKRVRISLNVSMETVYTLDQLKTDIRRSIPRTKISTISKSSMIDAAVDLFLEDFKEKGLESVFVKKILND